MKLQIKDESGKTTVVPITRDEITIGRKEGNTIRLTERNVSRTHARFLKKGDEIHVEDVSRYGTRVNGERITETRRVGAGDTIQIGDYLLSLEGVKAVEDPAQAKQAAAGAAAAAVSQTMTEFKGNEKKRAELEAAAKNQIAAAKAEMGAPGGGASAKKKEPTIPPGGKKDLEHTGEVSGDEIRRSRGAGKKRIGANHPTLVAVTTHLAGSEYPITTETMILGRTGENDLKVDHHSISRNHAKIVMKDGKVRMVDLQSKNGIRVNGEYWEESSLKSGDIIELGKVQFRFVEKGEEFIFRPEDYTDEQRAEEPKKSGKGMLVAIVLLAAGGLAALYFLVIAKPSDKPIVPNVPVGNTVAPPQPATAPPTQPATQPDVAVAAPDTTAVAEPDTALATPPPTPVDHTATIKELLDKAGAAAGAQKWDEASQHLDGVLALDAEHAQAKALQVKVASEKAVQAAFAEAQAAQGQNDLLGTWKALQKLAAMPPDSSYAAAVTEMRGAVGSAIANGLVDQAKQALAKKLWNDAIAMAEEAQKYLPNHAEAPELIARAKRLKAEEARKEAQRDQPKEPKPPKEPAGKSADEIYKEARALHNTDEAAALTLYEQAAAKGYASAHKMIASIKIKRGDNKGAVASYKKYLELVPGAKDADTVRDIITKLGGTL